MAGSYTRLVLVSIATLIAPIPIPNPIPPTAQMITLIIVELRGVNIGIIINRNIPTIIEISIDIQSFCFAIELIRR